jgi:DNA ligase (NAD+)
VPEIGPVVAESIHKWFAAAKNREVIDKLRSAGVAIEPYRRANGRLDGKTFVVTGTLAAMSRQEAKDRIRELGGTAVESVSKNTDYVVVGENPGSKREKAKKLGVRVIGEEEFRGLVG